MISKIIIVLVCVAAMASLSHQTDVQPAPCKTNDAKGINDACSGTIKNCQDGLGGVTGPGATQASLLSIALEVTIGPLLANVGKLLSELLATVGSIVIKLLEVVLALLAVIVSLVIKLLSGLLGNHDYQTQCNSAYNDASSKVSSYGSSNPALGGVVTVILSLLGNLLQIVLSIKL